MKHPGTGKYHIRGKTYKQLVGSRQQVFHGTAYKTEGNLKKEGLLKNKWGRIVSRKKHNTSIKEKRLEKYGYFAKKGQFGFVRKTARASRKR